ncbi:MAG: hypothetical protein WAL41_20930, partial [Mycobacterium sp.]
MDVKNVRRAGRRWLCLLRNRNIVNVHRLTSFDRAPRWIPTSPLSAAPAPPTQGRRLSVGITPKRPRTLSREKALSKRTLSNTLLWNLLADERADILD